MEEKIMRINVETGGGAGWVYNQLIPKDLELSEEHIISSRIKLSLNDCAPSFLEKKGVVEVQLGGAKGRIHRIPQSVFVTGVDIESDNVADFLRLRQALLAYVGGQIITLSAVITDHPCSFVGGLRNDLVRLKAWIANGFRKAKQRLGLRIASIGYDASCT